MMAEHRKLVTSRSRNVAFSLKQLLISVAVASVIIALGVSIYKQERVGGEFEYTRRALKEIVNALRDYQLADGNLPYSERGSDAALFLLQGTVRVQAFERFNRQHGEGSARWDLAAMRLRNSGVKYLNAPKTRIDNRRVILACASREGGHTFYATGDGVVGASGGSVPTSDVLGCWITLEGFLVAEKRTFVRWCERHSADHIVELRSTGSAAGPSEAQLKDGSRILYFYENGTLTRCEHIGADGKTVIEAVRTDRYGRITDIHLCNTTSLSCPA